MKVVIQRVTSASVLVDERVVGSILSGYFLLLGISTQDKPETAIKLAEKVSKIRLMSDSYKKMNLDLKSAEGECLVVSQFTLNSDTSGGNRPSFVSAAKSEQARPLYELFIKTIKDFGIKVQTGEFGSYMNLDIKLDGPVTIVLEQ